MSASLPILATKLYIPLARPASRHVSRPRLTARLSDGLSRPLTLISAPAGSGKTTLVTEWWNGTGRSLPLAWLSLDETDNDPARFLTGLITALGTLNPKIGDAARAALKSPRPPPPQATLATLVNDLKALPVTCALILDDYHVITAEPVHESLTFLLDHLPPQLRLVILARADPPLPLARLRARDQLTDIRGADLRFTPDEAATFLNQVMGLNLPSGAVATLEARTEGWIVGLQLAALSLQWRDVQGRADFIAAFGGSHRYILDYLADEVLNVQPEPIR